jgi:hypothetical protein
MESEAKLDWKVSTGKHKAACEVAGIPPDSPADVLLDVMLADIQSFKRMAFMFAGVVPQRWIDGMIDRMMSRTPKK